MNSRCLVGKNEAASSEFETQPELGILAETKLVVEAPNGEEEFTPKGNVLGHERVAPGLGLFAGKYRVPFEHVARPDGFIQRLPFPSLFRNHAADNDSLAAASF